MEQKVSVFESDEKLLQKLHYFANNPKNWVFEMTKTTGACGSKWLVTYGGFKESGTTLLEALTKLEARVEKV